jgi:hypothetical protein
VKLNKELLLRARPTTEKMLLTPECGVCHDIDFKNWEE